jgi:Pyridoxamine 5'-phosphate oxidase
VWEQLASSEAILIRNTVVKSRRATSPPRRTRRRRGRTGELREFLDRSPVGVLATRTAGDGPRRSVVYFARDGERLMISTLTDRLKAQDVRRTGWASLYVMGHRPPYPVATFSGPAEILTEDIGGPTARIAQRMSGATEPPEPMRDAALAEVGRVKLAIAIERVTAANYIEATTTSAEAGGERN